MGSSRMLLLLWPLLMGLGLEAEADLDGEAYGLDNRLSYVRRENDAIARLYENILDVLQCRLPRESGAQIKVGKDALLAKQPVQDQNWRSPKGLGQVSGVAIDPAGRPVIFHRGDHIWDFDSFDEENRFTKRMDGPIAVNTVLTLNPENGQVEDEWGSDAFYLPHGIYVDAEGSVWLTDVALHQVLKEGTAEPEPSLVLGERFVPGGDARHLCQPTSVLVLPGGEIVVADGYCNERILLFDPMGRLLEQIPPRGNEDMLRLRVPHSLTLVNHNNVCVADREHQRIVCFNLTRTLEEGAPGRKEQMLSWLPLVIHRPGACRIFGVTSHNNMLYAVNGPTTSHNPVMGFTLDPENGSVVSTWAPTFDSFSNPHEIAACPNGTALYVSEIGPNVVWKFRLLTNWKM
ncbi:PREDICTED: peptidyl-alpha-hydroxyglycine alpha-amidating lyase 2 [Ceratosolen solmsi marchali]|uniref:peptidylamidoglycolate lyase n=1 Tax=Ceratosolen solmsi marchali TaxID=326594 RepID=A0AAJ6YIC4_9HYME|nr:PREDICTED: peptidyl-alpha-hydroxyglycine alpha-amidating lyase 2 [Ceratosolen solmsi marchali]